MRTSIQWIERFIDRAAQSLAMPRFRRTRRKSGYRCRGSVRSGAAVAHNAPQRGPVDAGMGGVIRAHKTTQAGQIGAAHGTHGLHGGENFGGGWRCVSVETWGAPVGKPFSNFLKSAVLSVRLAQPHVGHRVFAHGNPSSPRVCRAPPTTRPQVPLCTCRTLHVPVPVAAGPNHVYATTHQSFAPVLHSDTAP